MASQLIDLTHTLKADTPVFPGDRSPLLIHEHHLETSGYNQFYFSGSMHIGTHLDGPMHMTNDPRYIADLPLNQFIGKGILIDATGKDSLSLSETDRQRIEPETIVLFHTGWDRYFGNERYFREYPALEEESARFLIEKKVKIVGFDSPSPDHSPYPLHPLFFANNVLLLENLTHLDLLVGIPGFEIMAFPLKIMSDGSLVRVVARVD